MIKNFTYKEKYDITDVLHVVHLLRDPVDGCPWDKEQTHESIRKNFLEEAYEACDAIDKNDSELLCEELGDVLLQVALHSEIEEQAGGFNINDVSDGLCKKLIARHPHIFGDVSANDSKTVLANWEDIKRRQKGQEAGSKPIDDVPDAFPALYKCQKVQKRAGDAGFDYNNVREALSDLKSEICELECALDNDTNIEEEIGDIIFSAVNVSRLCGVDAEFAATAACNKFKTRFKMVESASKEAGLDMKTCGMDKLNKLWKNTKNKE